MADDSNLSMHLSQGAVSEHGAEAHMTIFDERLEIVAALTLPPDFARQAGAMLLTCANSRLPLSKVAFAAGSC